jgi:hypothetical protein
MTALAVLFNISPAVFLPAAETARSYNSAYEQTYEKFSRMFAAVEP